MNKILNKTVLEHLKDARSFELTATKQQKLAGKEFTEAKEMILTGDSTGDLLRDYVVTTTGIDSEELTQLLHKTEELLINNVGELILFVYTWEDDLMKHAIEPNRIFEVSNKVQMKHLYLGVLNNNKLVVDLQKELCDFPTTQLFENGDGPFYFNYQITPGNAVIQNILISGHPWEFKIGFADIVEWMNKNSSYTKCIVDMSTKLGKLEDFSFLVD